MLNFKVYVPTWWAFLKIMMLKVGIFTDIPRALEL